MGKTNVGQLRLMDSAEKVFEKAFNLINLKDALKLISSLAGRPIMESYEVKEYHSKTGKPQKFQYVPYEAWDGNLWLGTVFNCPAVPKGSNLHKLLFAKLKIGDSVRIGNIVIKFVPDVSEGDAFSGGTIPKHLKFERVKKL